MFAALLLAATLAASQPLSIEDYATMPSISSPQFSPDGKRVVYVVSIADMTRSAYDSNLWMVDSDGRNPIQLTHSTASDSRPRWSPADGSVAFLSDRDGRSAIWLLNAAGGEPYRLTKEPAPIRWFEWSPDGKSIAFLMTEPQSPEEERRIKEKEDVHVVGEGRRQQHLYIIDVASRAVRRMSCCDFSIASVAWSPDGRTLAVERRPSPAPDDEFYSDLFLVDAASFCDDRSCPSMLPLVVRPGIDAAPRFSPDGKSIAFTSDGGIFDWLREHQIWVVDLATRTPRLVSAEYDRTPAVYAWSSDSRTIWFDGALNTTAQLFRVGADGSGFRNVSNVQAVIEGASFEQRAERAVFVMESLASPQEVYVADLTKPFAPRAITHHNESYLNRQLGETRLIHWTNPNDGLPIEGLLTLPLGYKPGSRVPLLTVVHGGPNSHFEQGYLGYAGTRYAPQVLAARGFAILRPNPRGSGGYGQRFLAANRGDWGGLDWVDINAGIDKVIADGIADPKHLGLMGWSYGGFMAAWAIGHSDRLLAISVGAPVVDLLSFHGTTDIRYLIPGYFAPAPAASPAAAAAQPNDAAILETLKHVPLSLDALRAHSPLWQLHPTRAHVLIQQGEADERVPLSQGTMLYRTLQEMGVDVSMVTYPRSPHVPREPKQRIDVMRRNVEFFSKWVR
jgi:dipeptidyl aminopeptidase/acylaminoacyl peptidase